MQPAFTCFGHMFLTLDYQLQLSGHFAEFAKDVFVSRHKPQPLVLDTCFVAETDDQLLQSSKVVTWYAREQVVYGLELQATMDKIEPRRALDVHCGSKLMLGEAFRFAEVTGRHRPMRQRDLHMQGHRDDMGDQHEHDTKWPRWNTPPYQTITKEKPIY